MAPAARAAHSQAGKKQATISGFGRITKSAAATTVPKQLSLKAAPAARVTEPASSSGNAGKKRGHDEFEEDQECSFEEQIPRLITKKPKIQPRTFDTSSEETSPIDLDFPANSSDSVSFAKPITVANLPSTLRSILILHENFLKALSIHYAHNGASAPAELEQLMTTVTCLWKKRPVRKEDIQRMLALYEISSEQIPVFQPGRTISHNVSPFRLASFGPVGSMRISIEYVGTPDSQDAHAKGVMRSTFSEKNLQCLFELDLVCLFKRSLNQNSNQLAFLAGQLSQFPLLSSSAGTQSALSQEKASTRRKEILELSAQSQQRQNMPKTIKVESTDSVSELDVGLAVKSRTQSLFDRIAAKAALAASSTAPSAADIQRHHAIGRIGEVVEVLRMKQAQKSTGRNHFLSDSNTTSPPRSQAQRVSFSMKQLQSEIRDSSRVAIGDDEIRLCLNILAEESEKLGGWMRILKTGFGERKTQFVVLEGKGMVGRDVQRMLEEGGKKT